MRPILLLLGKDLRVLRRSPVLLAMLLTYPLLIAALVGLVAQYASAKPRVALVDEDHLPSTIVVAGKTFHVDDTIDEISRNVKLVRLPPAEADRQLSNGRLVEEIVVPEGFLAELQAHVHSPHLTLKTGQCSPHSHSQPARADPHLGAAHAAALPTRQAA